MVQAAVRLIGVVGNDMQATSQIERFFGEKNSVLTLFYQGDCYFTTCVSFVLSLFNADGVCNKQVFQSCKRVETKSRIKWVQQMREEKGREGQEGERKHEKQRRGVGVEIRRQWHVQTGEHTLDALVLETRTEWDSQRTRKESKSKACQSQHQHLLQHHITRTQTCEWKLCAQVLTWCATQRSAHDACVCVCVPVVCGRVHVRVLWNSMRAVMCICMCVQKSSPLPSFVRLSEIGSPKSLTASSMVCVSWLNLRDCFRRDNFSTLVSALGLVSPMMQK